MYACYIRRIESRKTISLSLPLLLPYRSLSHLASGRLSAFDVVFSLSLSWEERIGKGMRGEVRNRRVDVLSRQDVYIHRDGGGGCDDFVIGDWALMIGAFSVDRQDLPPWAAFRACRCVKVDGCAGGRDRDGNGFVPFWGWIFAPITTVMRRFINGRFAADFLLPIFSLLRISKCCSLFLWKM